MKSAPQLTAHSQVRIAVYVCLCIVFALTLKALIFRRDGHIVEIETAAKVMPRQL